MKLKELTILIMLGIILYLFVQKTPKFEPQKIKYLTKYEKQIDTITKEIVKIRSIKKPYFDTIVIYKEKIIEARQNKDTINLIAFQDSVIKKQDIYILFQDTLINKSDSIISLQNKEKTELKETISNLEKDAQKQKKRNRIKSFVAGAGLLTLLILK
jgi:hypothetical protein